MTFFHTLAQHNVDWTLNDINRSQQREELIEIAPGHWSHPWRALPSGADESVLNLGPDPLDKSKTYGISDLFPNINPDDMMVGGCRKQQQQYLIHVHPSIKTNMLKSSRSKRVLARPKQRRLTRNNNCCDDAEDDDDGKMVEHSDMDDDTDSDGASVSVRSSPKKRTVTDGDYGLDASAHPTASVWDNYQGHFESGIIQQQQQQETMPLLAGAAGQPIRVLPAPLATSSRNKVHKRQPLPTLASRPLSRIPGTANNTGSNSNTTSTTKSGASSHDDQTPTLMMAPSSEDTAAAAAVSTRSPTSLSNNYTPALVFQPDPVYLAQMHAKGWRLGPTERELEAVNGTDRSYRALAIWYGRLVEVAEYRLRFGDCNVPHKFDKLRGLCNWVNKQRMEKKARDDGLKNTMTDDKIEALEQLGFTWAKRKGEYCWNLRFSQLKAFKEQHGMDKDPPTKYNPIPPLGRWVSTQRTHYHKNMLTASQVAKLKSVNFSFTGLNFVYNGEIYNEAVSDISIKEGGQDMASIRQNEDNDNDDDEATETEVDDNDGNDRNRRH